MCCGLSFSDLCPGLSVDGVFHAQERHMSPMGLYLIELGL